MRLPAQSAGRDSNFSQNYTMISPSLNGSPHSGQNFGGWVGSSGSQPHLSHLYFGVPAGFFVPHSAQNLPLFSLPHEAGKAFPYRPMFWRLHQDA